MGKVVKRSSCIVPIRTDMESYSRFCRTQKEMKTLEKMEKNWSRIREVQTLETTKSNGETKHGV